MVSGGSSMSEGPKHLDDLFLGAVTVGERGQIVIPAEAREAYDISGGDKLLVFHHPGHCGLMVTRVQDVQHLLESARKLVEAVEGLETQSETDLSEAS
jgi:AbrB family looped-hinge helix DNA binding protein